MNKSLLIALSILAVVACGDSPQQDLSDVKPMSRDPPTGNLSGDSDESNSSDNGPRIYYGTDAERGEFPFMARFLVESGGSVYQCGGAMLGERVMITAAHCIVGEPSNAQIVLGDHTGSTDLNEEYYGVESWVMHKNYDDSSLANDIALVYLSRNANFTNEYIGAISLPTVADQALYDEGAAVTVIGWGGTESQYKATTLQKLAYNFVSDDTCKQYWSSSILPGMACTGMVPAANESHSWAGDSGGPLFATNDDGTWTLTALVSWGTSDDSVLTWDVNTKVLYYVQNGWIADNMGDNDEDGNETDDGDEDEEDGDGTVVLKILNDYTSMGVVLASTDPSDDDSWAFLCNDGVGRNEVNAICRNLGFSTGILIDPYSLDGKYDLTEMYSYGATDISCPANAGTNISNYGCDWTWYEMAEVPCVDGQQLAVSCADTAWEFEISRFETKVNKKGKAMFACYASANRYGMPMKMGDNAVSGIANRDSNGNYTLVLEYNSMKYKNSKGYWKGKAYVDISSDDQCFICVAFIKYTYIFDIKIDPDCSYDLSEDDVWSEISSSDEKSRKYPDLLITPSDYR